MKGSTTARKFASPATSSIQTHAALRPKQNEVYEDYSEAVENWRQKREQKRKQSLNSNRTEEESNVPKLTILKPSPPSPIKKQEESEIKTPVSLPPTIISSPSKPLSVTDRIESKSPSPQRIKGSAKIHEIFIEKSVDVRGFGFKLDGGHTQNRPVYISTLEEGSPADKAGLCVEDEVISMNDENIEHMTFDQVRKILKERNLRGSIKLIVRTFEENIEDNSQTVTIEHSRTPSPQKSLINTPTLNNIRISSLSATNVQSPVYTFLPFTSPSSSIPSTNTSVHQTSGPSLNIFAPKPFRSTASISLETQNSTETNLSHSSAIEAFRKMLHPSNSIDKSTKNETIGAIEQESTSREIINTLLSSPEFITSSLTDKPLPIPINKKMTPPPLSSVESLLQITSDNENNSNNRLSKESPIGQTHSSVEKQISQLKQELLIGVPRTQKIREQNIVNIPVDIKTSSTTKTFSNEQQNSNVLNQTFTIKSNLYENSSNYVESSNQQRPLSSSLKSKNSHQEIPSTGNSSNRSVNELRVNLSSPSSFQQDKNISLQINETTPQQRTTGKQFHTTLNQTPRKSHYDDHSSITDEQKKSMFNSTTPTHSLHNNEKNGSNRRSASLNPHNQDFQLNRQTSNQLSMFHYDDHTNEHNNNHYIRNTQQQISFDQSNTRHHQSKNRIKSPVRTTINSNNNRVLSVSGKLRCSRCNDELGQGSAMVIESLDLYYHIECFRCFVCNIPLSSSFEGTDVRVRSNRLHCQNCFSDENGTRRSKV